MTSYVPRLTSAPIALCVSLRVAEIVCPQSVAADLIRCNPSLALAKVPFHPVPRRFRIVRVQAVLLIAALLIAALVVIVGTTVWLWRDYSGLFRTYDKKPDVENATAWIVGCLFSWVIVFPLYLSTRGRRQRDLEAEAFENKGVLRSRGVR